MAYQETRPNWTQITNKVQFNWTMNSRVLVPHHASAKSPTYKLDFSRILNPSRKQSYSTLTANKKNLEERNSLLQAVITNPSDPEIPYRQRKESVRARLDLDPTQAQEKASTHGSRKGASIEVRGGAHVPSWTSKGGEPGSRRRKRAALVCTSPPAQVKGTGSQKCEEDWESWPAAGRRRCRRVTFFNFFLFIILISFISFFLVL